MLKRQVKWPQNLLEIRESVRRAIQKFGKTNPAHTEDLAALIADELCADFGGGQFYMPNLRNVKLWSRDEAIRRDFSGRNHRELARKYKISEPRIYQIVSPFRGNN